MRPSFLLALATASWGCSNAVPGADAAVEDAGPESCDTDRSCPDGAPVWGGRCEGTLSCTFNTMCGGHDVYECVSGDWTLTMPDACAGAPPPLYESCRTPETTAIPGSRVWLSSDAAGAPELHDGDLVEVAFGAQGLAMIPYRVHVDAEVPPRCVEVVATTTLETMSAPPATHQVRLRCGGSLRIQDVLPELPCDEREYAVGLDVTLTGIGSVSLDLRAMGGGCMFGG